MKRGADAQVICWRGAGKLFTAPRRFLRTGAFRALKFCVKIMEFYALTALARVRERGESLGNVPEGLGKARRPSRTPPPARNGAASIARATITKSTREGARGAQ